MNDQLAKWFVLALALGMAVLAWRAWQVKQASPGWPSVEGEMLVARAFARNETGEARGTPAREWLTEVRYRYTVQGRDYTGRRIRAFVGPYPDQASAMADVAPFQVGARVKVYYDPADPGNSVLVPG